jgi:hypothetical protein
MIALSGDEDTAYSRALNGWRTTELHRIRDYHIGVGDEWWD